MTIESTCDACKKPITIADDQSPRLCTECAKKTGLAFPLASRRGAWPCMRCGSTVLVRAQVRERSVVSGSDHARSQAEPFAVTFATSEEYKALLSFEKQPSATPDLGVAYGLLDAYICRACGFVEWYAQEPEKIPVGATFGTQLVEVPGAAPYRGP